MKIAKMKPSLYNRLIKLPSGKSLVYNSMSDSFLVLTESGVAAISDMNILCTEKSGERRLFLNQLNANGFIVEDHENEVEKLDKLIDDIDNHDTVWRLHINPTLDCTCNCWYCYENHVKGSVMGQDTVNNVVRLISNIVGNETTSGFHLSFFGGEPLMHFSKVAKPIIEATVNLCKIKDMPFTTHFTTNGILVSDSILDALPRENVSFQITLDGNKENHDKTRYLANGEGTYDIILRNINKILKRGFTLVLRINYTTDNYSSIKEIAEDLSKFAKPFSDNITIDLQRVWQDSSKYHEKIGSAPPLASDLVNVFNSAGFRVSSYKGQNSVRSSCYGNKRNYALINYNGDVFCCTARDFTKENRAGYLSSDGEIIWIKGIKENRTTARFKKKICRECYIAPICGGGCRQKSIEDKSESDKCPFGYDESDKDNIILDRFELNFMQKREEVNL